MLDSQNTPSIIDQILRLLPIVGWGTLITIVWKFRGAVDTFIASWTESGKQIEATKTVAAQIKIDVDNLTNLHMKRLGDALVDVCVTQRESNVIHDKYLVEMVKMREDFHDHTIDDKHIQAGIKEALDDIKRTVT